MLYFEGKSNCLTFRKRDLVAILFAYAFEYDICRE